MSSGLAGLAGLDERAISTCPATTSGLCPSHQVVHPNKAIPPHPELVLFRAMPQEVRERLRVACVLVVLGEAAQRGRHDGCRYNIRRPSCRQQAMMITDLAWQGRVLCIVVVVRGQSATRAALSPLLGCSESRRAGSISHHLLHHRPSSLTSLDSSPPLSWLLGRPSQTARIRAHTHLPSVAPPDTGLPAIPLGPRVVEARLHLTKNPCNPRPPSAPSKLDPLLDLSAAPSSFPASLP